MKRKIGAILVVCLIMLGTLSLAAYGGGVAISQTMAGSTTDLSHPAAYVADGQGDTYWCLQADTAQGWVQLTLAKPALIYGLKLTGSIGSATTLTVEYQSGGDWLPFTAATLTALPADGRVDLSWDRVVAQTLRIRLNSSSYASGYLSEVEVLGEAAASILHRLQPERITTDAHTSPNAPVSFLSDGNTYTGWQLRGSATQGTAVFQFPVISTLNQIKLYFSSALSGEILIEALDDTHWEQVARVSNQPAGWYRVDLSNAAVTTNQVRLTVAGGYGKDTGLSEVEFWGYGDFRGDLRQPIGGQEPIAISPSSQAANTVDSSRRFKILYSSANTTAITNSLQHNLKLYNTGSTDLNLADVKLRYWYTNEPAQQQVAQIYWSNVGSQNITTQFVTVQNRTNADTYLEIGFSSAAGTLAPGNCVEIKLGINASDWTSYNQANDFSFTSDSGYVENPQYTGYLDGTRAWGREPDSTNDTAVNLQFTKPASPVLCNQAADGRLKVLSQNTTAAATTNSIQANLKLENTGYETLDLTKVKLRYWYSNETQKKQIAHIYWASSGTSKVTASFGTATGAGTTADTYLELGFSEGALGPGETVAIKFGLNASDWSNYLQTNDYSFTGSSSAYAENVKVTAYIDNQLAWGVEPDTRPVFDQAIYRLELSFDGLLTENAVVQVNNTPLELKPGLILNNRTIYCGELTAAQLWNGVNYLRIKPFSTAVTLENAFITRHHPDGQCLVAWEGLSDGLLLTPATPLATECELGQQILIEEATVTTVDHPAARLYAWVNGTWTELTNWKNIDYGVRFTGPVTTDKLKLEASGSVGELIIKGSIITDQAPTVQIFWPNDGAAISREGWADQELLGLVDNPQATVGINGTAVALDGHYFTFPLSEITAPNGENVTLTATAQDISGRTGNASVTVTAGTYSDVTLDQPDKLVYTAASAFTISGTVNKDSSQYQVNVAGTGTPLSGNRFVTSVSLKEGLNLIEVQALKNSHPVKTFYRRVVKSSDALALTVRTPETGAYLNTPTVKVTGSINGLAPLKVTVNGITATVSATTYTATVPLTEGSNKLTIVGRDAAGHTITQTVTVNRDTCAPVITKVTPAEGAVFATGSVTASAAITDAHPLWVTINGQAVTGEAGIYRKLLRLEDGDRTITLTAQDGAGNTATVKVNIMVDTAGPASFTPVANISGWTNNNKPTVTFSTTDATSGLDHYEISVDDGASLGVVTSPYQFTTGLADGEHILRVWAYDKAGNGSVGTVTVHIDTTAPGIPADFEVIGGINRMILKWQGEDPAGEIVGYRITRTPAFISGSYVEIFRASETSDLSKYVDETVADGAEYVYTLQAIDHAGNVSAATKARSSKVGSLTQTVTSGGGTFKFDHCQLTIPEGAIDFNGQIVIKEAENTLPDNSYATKTGSAYQFKLLDTNGNEVQAKFNSLVTLTVSYDDLAIPDGFTEDDLGVYWYNPNGGCWEKLDYTVFDFENATMAVKLQHFSDYQVMASKYRSPSLDSYYNMGVSPFQSYFQNNAENVSPYNGSLTASATDLALPGRSGTSTVIQRIYDSQGAEQEKMIEANPDSYQKTPVDTFGAGWSLNIPWIEQTDKGKFIRLPGGQTIKIELDSNKQFKYHAGVHFIMEGTSTLTMNDGTQYKFDGSGRVTSQTDPSGLNQTTYKYNGRELTQITDALGHVVKFEYTTAGSTRAISKITVGDRSVSYLYDSAGNLIKAIDPMKRETGYAYQTQTFKTGLYNNKGDNDTFWYSFSLLNAITYPTGEKSTYTYEILDQYYKETIKKKCFGITVAHIRLKYYGSKVLVQSHQVAGKKTDFSYQMNAQTGTFKKGNFVPAYTYMKQFETSEGQLNSQMIFQQIVGTGLVDSPGNMDKYKGPLVTQTSTAIGDNQLVERIALQYHVPLRAVTQEDHYRGGLLVYSITSQYDDWGNLTYRLDGSRNLEETSTYYKQSDLFFKNLVVKSTVKNQNPLTNSSSLATTSYTYDDQLGKPLTVSVNDGSQTKTARFTYDAWGNLKTKTDEANDNFKTEVFYDDAYHAFPVKQTAYGVRDADGTARDITTEAEYDWETGLKQWEKDARGFVTRYEYDALNRVTKVTLPDDDTDGSNNPSRENVFHDDTNSCEFYNEKRQKTLFTFDGLGRLTKVTKESALYSGGVTTTYQYNSLGQISQVTDALGNGTSYEYDGLNRVTKVTYPGGAEANLSYDDATNTTTVTDENGGVVTEQNDWAGRLILAKQYCKYNGYTDIYTWRTTYDSLGNKLRQIDPQSNTTDQSFDALGHLTTVLMPKTPLILPGTTAVTDYQPAITYEYNPAGFKTGEISANENAKGSQGKTSYTYDQLGRVIAATVQAKEVITGQMVKTTTKTYYDAAGNKIKTVDGNGGVWTYTYSARGQLLTETDPAGHTTRYQYDVLGNKTAVTDPRGNGLDGTFTTWYEYDDLNRLTKTILPDNTPGDRSDNPATETTYDANGNKLTERDPNGVVTSYTYTPRNWVETVSLDGELKTKYVYDAKGNQTEIYDALGQVTKKVYDSLGRVRKVTLEGSDAITETYSYDEVGNKTAVTDGRENTTTYTYNSLGWQTRVTDPLGHQTQYCYDPNGNQVKVVTPNKLVMWNTYDELNRVVTQTDSLSQSTKVSYDGAGNRKQVIDRRGTIWIYQYAPNNLLKRIDLSGDGTSYDVEYTYDAAGNRIETQDSGNTVKYNYHNGVYQADPLNRVNAVDRSFGGATYRTAYQYDPAGLLTGIKYPEATAWLKYNYNRINQLTSVEGFTATQGMTYDANGALKTLTYANGVKASYSYDGFSRLQDYQVTLDDANILKQNFTYDKSHNITTITEGAKTKTYDYDAANQLTRAITPGQFLETNPTSGTYGIKAGDYLGASALNLTPTLTAMMGLDYNSSSIGIDFGTVASGVKQIKVIPDKAYQTHRVVERTIDLYTSGNNMTYTVIPRSKWKFTKDSRGVITITFNDRLATRYLKVHVKLDDRDAKFKAKDKATFLNDFAKMLRVYQESASRTEEFAYDGDGNRILQRLTLVQTNSYSSAYYSNSDRLKTDGKYAFKYDAAGNVTEKGNAFTINGDTVTFTTTGDEAEYWKYTYDLLNRLIAVTKNGIVVSEYAYDPEGLRVIKKAKGVTTHYVFEGTEPIFEKKIATGKTKSYVYALGKYLARVDGIIGDTTAQKYFYHTDHLGSIRAVTDTDGKVVYKSDYLAFGTRYGTETDGDFDESHGFTGKEYDPDTGLYYYNARWYDSDLGRFISEDPAADPNNPNLYSYCGNNPVMRTDPSGMVFGWDDLIYAIVASWVVNAVKNACDVYNDGGDFWTGFVYGLAYPTVGVQINYGNGKTPTVGQRKETTGSFEGLSYAVGDYWVGGYTAPGYINIRQETDDISNLNFNEILDDSPLLASNDSKLDRKAIASLRRNRNNSSENSEYRSAEYLRLFVPGQISFDNGINAWNNGRYGESILWFSSILAEDYLYVVSFGRSMTTSYGAATAVRGVARKTIVNKTSVAILKDGYYEVNGFKFSEKYYNKLWNTGRGGASLVAKEILKYAKKVTPDEYKEGFYRYVYSNWEMVYNPLTKEVWHIMPKK